MSGLALLIDEEEANSERLSIYPNPASNEVTVIAPKINGSFKYELFSIDGKLVTSGLSAESQSEIDFSELNDGVYLLEVVNSENFEYHAKIIKH